jgi:hypothetical protein
VDLTHVVDGTLRQRRWVERVSTRSTPSPGSASPVTSRCATLRR